MWRALNGSRRSRRAGGALATFCALFTLGCGGASSAPPTATATPATATAHPSSLPSTSASPESPSTAPTAQQGDWLASAKPSLRALTVLVRTRPPPALAAKYRQLATRYAPLKPLFLALADESFGSGFVMVRRGQPPTPFVVTNRHVVGMASRVEVTLGTEGTANSAEVVYVDDQYDLAVLSLSAPSEEWTKLGSGLGFASAPARDQDEVVASGYPGIGDRPSYQVTRGFVSNERFVLNDAASEQHYVQHTAPIDPGSSGGPLTTPDGKLLGVNTLKVRGRENVGLAVPAPVVEKALTQAARRAAESSLPSAAEQAHAACESLLAKVAGGTTELPALEGLLGAAMVAEHGPGSLPTLPQEDDEWAIRFLQDPTGVFRHALALRLQQGASKTDAPACTPREAKASGDGATFQVRLAGALRPMTFAREQGRWKLVAGTLGRPSGHSFLDQVDAQHSAPKPWKPSMR